MRKFLAITLSTVLMGIFVVAPLSFNILMSKGNIAHADTVNPFDPNTSTGTGLTDYNNTNNDADVTGGDDAGVVGGDDAAPVGGNDANPTGGNNSNTNTNNGTTNTSGFSLKLDNPLKYSTICSLLTAIIGLITQIGAVIAVILIIWTGFKFITAQGNPAAISSAKNAFYTTVIGTAVLLGASAIAQIVIKTVFTITNGNNPAICNI